ncbi:MAG: glycosyltransferase family 2 protein [Bacteroidaceae bacterium]|nr:glycosyltransferase family 2 protein [Bacteroidaceae bacterium]
MHAGRTKLSIVILNWNGAGMMRRFLPSVLRHSGDAEIVVADNGSTDDSLELLERDFPSVRRIVLGQNYGFAEGYNRGLAQLGSEYYLLLNSDVEVREGWLEPMLRYMDEHPEVAACQPKLLCQWSPEYFEYAGACGGYIDSLGYPYCRGRVMGTLETDRGQYDTVAPVLWATGACLLIRSDDYWVVGGLDERFFAHQEEIDLCWRLRSRGRSVVCVPDSVAYHLGGGTLPQGNPRKTFLNFRNNLLLLYKNLPEDRLRPVMRIRFWLDAIASLQFLLTMQWGSFLAVWRARRAYRRMRPDFRKDREENQRLAVLSSVPEQSAFSLLWRYYIKGEKTYSELCR